MTIKFWCIKTEKKEESQPHKSKSVVALQTTLRVHIHAFSHIHLVQNNNNGEGDHLKRSQNN